MGKITTKGRITIMLGQRQAVTGERLSPRRLAQLAGVPKDLVYRLDAGQARYVDLKALTRLCDALDCRAGDILVWESGERRAEIGDQRLEIGDTCPGGQCQGLGGDNGRVE